MKTSGVWRGNRTTKKKTRPAYKPKIRWELLGLSDPEANETITSIETIRQEVSSLASRGFGQDTRARTAGHDSTSTGRGRRTGTRKATRRGATE